MAQNLTKRLDRIERLIKERLSSNEGPIYLSEGEPIPEGREAIVIAMRWVEAEHQEDSQAETSFEARLGANSGQRKTSLTLPPPETPAEREKRWSSHLRAIDARGERYHGEEGPRNLRREDWQRGIV